MIAIIAILAGMLLPALSKAREKGHAILCLSHEKQIYTALMIYASDSEDYLPYTSTNCDYAVQAAKYMGIKNEATASDLAQDKFWASKKTSGVFFCNSNQPGGSPRWSSSNPAATRSYTGYVPTVPTNNYVNTKRGTGGWSVYDGTSYRKAWRRISAFPVRSILFGEGTFYTSDGTYNKAMPLYNRGYSATLCDDKTKWPWGWNHDRGRGCNVTMIDGSAQTLRFRGVRVANDNFVLYK